MFAHETSILHHFDQRTRQLADAPAIWRPIGEGFEAIRWSELRTMVCRAASALRRSGVVPGSPVVHVSENRWEWIVADLAISATGGVHVPAHAPLSGAQVAYQATDTAAATLLLSDQAQCDKLLEQSLPDDLRIISYEPKCRLDGRSVEDWELFLAEGDEEDGQAILAATLETLDADTVSTILYTSGTTGQPKGVMLSHRNLCSNAEAANDAFAQSPDDIRLTFLPLSHIFARTCDLYTTIVGGSQIGLARSRESVLADCQQLKPTHLNGVPYFFQKLQQGLLAAGKGDDPLALKFAFGGAVRYLCSGGAPLAVDTFDFFDGHGLPILQGYGLTETSPVITASTIDNNRRGSAGLPLAGVEVRCAADGEILTRGPHVMLGYYQDADATRQMITDGWLATGDYGKIDEDGFVYITGRKKEIIVLSSGKNIAPTLLEDKLCQSPLIEQAMVVGDDRPYLIAILVAGATVDVAAEGASDSVQAAVDEQLADFSHHEQVRKILLLAEPFSIERGELTPKLSIRRNVLLEHHRAAIDAIYATGR